MGGRGTESHACVPERNKHAGVLVHQKHYVVQARVPKTWDSRVAEAEEVFAPVVKFDRGFLFLERFLKT
jgi:hypothetical protein